LRLFKNHEIGNCRPVNIGSTTTINCRKLPEDKGTGCSKSEISFEKDSPTLIIEASPIFLWPKKNGWFRLSRIEEGLKYTIDDMKGE